MMNRKGHIPTYLLILIAIALSIGALFAFASFSNKEEIRAQELAEIMAEVNFGQNYALKSAELIGAGAIENGGEMKEQFMIIAAERELRIESAGNFFGKIRSGDFSFTKDGKEYILRVNGLFAQSERGLNKVRRDFDIVIKFDENGNVVK